MNYLIVDLDDTLLTSKKEISKCTLDGINKLKSMGFIFVINTARSFDRTKSIIDTVKPDYTILNGGASIVDKNNNVIFNKEIDSNIVSDIISLIKKNNIKDYSIQTSTDLYSSNIEYSNYNSFAKYYEFYKYDFNKSAEKILISDLNDDLWKDVANKYNLYFERYLSGTWFRISPSTKSLGNKILFKLLNDNDPKDYVFGDDYGDIDMINQAYHGVCMINASDNVKKNFKHFTKYDCDNDGVINYMFSLLNL